MCVCAKFGYVHCSEKSVKKNDATDNVTVFSAMFRSTASEPKRVTSLFTLFESIHWNFIQGIGCKNRWQICSRITRGDSSEFFHRSSKTILRHKPKNYSILVKAGEYVTDANRKRIAFRQPKFVPLSHKDQEESDSAALVRKTRLLTSMCMADAVPIG